MNLRMIAICLLLATMAPLPVFAQDVAPKAIPAEAQEAIRKGVIAAKTEDYPLAIRYFQEARRTAPDAPEIFYNLGLAESKIPGRELRAISWFGAYLSANQRASNAAAIWRAIEELQVKSQSNTLRLIRLLQDTADKMSSERNAMGSTPRTEMLGGAAELYARAGDTDQAISLAKTNGQKLHLALWFVKLGKLDEARRIIGTTHCEQETWQGASGATFFGEDYSVAFESVANAFAEQGDSVGALAILHGCKFPWTAGTWIAVGRVQLRNGDKDGARLSLAEAIKSRFAEYDTPKFKEELNNGVVPPPTPRREGNVGVQGWIDMLDDSTDDSCISRCPLNTPIFIDLPSHLRSLSSTNTWELAAQLYHAADIMIDAGTVIGEWLKTLAKQNRIVK